MQTDPSTDWQAYINSRPRPDATAPGVASLGCGHDPHPASALLSLSHLSPIRVRGDDALSFLQGQLSSDLAALAPGDAQLTAYCNPKGRTLGVFWVIRQQHGFDLLLPTDISSRVTARLTMFVMRAKVSIEADERVAIGCTGEIDRWPSETQAQLIALPDRTGRRVCLLEPAAAIELVTSADEQALPLYHSAVWRLLDIRAGIAMVYDATYEAFIPQMINLDLTDGISFSKGCYPGQEIIARLRYLGKLKQRTMRVKVSGCDAVGPGTPVFSPDKPDSKAGLMVDAVAVGEAQYEGLLMLPSNRLHDGDLAVGSADGPLVERLTLPYEISIEKPKGRIAPGSL